MVNGYLLDTNVLNHIFNEKEACHIVVKNRFDSLPPQAPVFISAVALGEIEYGHRCVSGEDREVHRRFNTFVQENIPYVLSVSASTRNTYGLLRAKLFHQYAPKDQRKKPKRPEELLEPTTAKALGIQENDLWMAAQAMEYRLVFVSADKMYRIREVAGDALQMEDWTET